MMDTPTPTELQLLQWVPSFEESEMERKEKEILEGHRVKLTEYIHDAAALFPYMKEKRVFTVDDCEIIQHCATARLRVDKCIDILFTKGPSAIGVFHEALARSYPRVFDFLTRLFTNHGVDLPDSRKMKPEEDFYQLLDSDDHESKHNSLNRQSTLPVDFRERKTNRFTIRKRLEVLSKQCETIQLERDNLKNALTEREKEISELLRSKEVSFNNLVTITQKYQHLYSELVQWKESLTTQSEDSDKRLQQVIDEREQIEQEYATLENDFVLCQSELCAARDRISRLLTHLERSEKMVAVMQETRDAFQAKVDSLELEKQFLQRKITRLVVQPRTKDAPEQENTKKEIELLRSDLEDMTERLKVARSERSQAIEEKESFLQKYYLERKSRKELEDKLLKLRKGPVTEVYSSTPDLSSLSVKMEDSTVRMQSADDVGMRLSLAVVVKDVSERSIAAHTGIRAGDLIQEVNHLLVGSDPSPLEFVGRVMRTAASFITLTVRRPVISYAGAGSDRMNYSPHTLPPRIHQTHTNDTTKTCTLPAFSLPAPRPGPLWEGGLTYRSDVGSHVTCTTPTGMSSVMMMSSSSGGMKSSSTPSTPATNSSAGDVDTLTKECVNGGRPPLLRSHPMHRMDSEDSVSNHTSSSNQDEYHQDDYISEILSDMHSNRDENCLIQSPTLPRQFTRDDSILPNSVTRPPTLRQKDYSPVSGNNFDEQLTQRLANLAESPGVQDSDEMFPRYYPMLSDPVNSYGDQETSPIPLTPTISSKPLVRRAANRRIRDKDRVKRLSQSCNDLGNIVSDGASKVESEATDVSPSRRVVLSRGQLSKGLTLVGGRGRGVFINSSKTTTHGLQTGDQLIKIGSEPVGKMTYADVMNKLNEYSISGDDCIVVVEQNMNAFSKLPNMEVRDSFYVKALFTNRRPRDGELVFVRGDMLHVVDTMPKGVAKQVWRAVKLDQFGDETTEIGFIPTDQSLSEMDNRIHSLPAIHSRRAKKGLGSAETMANSHSPQNSTCVYELYQPMCRKDATLPRPVVIVGVMENEVIQQLATDPDFAICPEETIGSTVKLHDSCCGEFVVLKREEEVHYCMVTKIQEMASKGVHCILPLDRNNLRALATPFSELALLYPIVIFLHTSKFTMTIMSIVHKVTDISKYSQETKTLMEQYSYLFSATVDVAGGVENTARQVKQEVFKQQNTAIWVPSAD